MILILIRTQVLFRVVPGFTFEMAQQGKLSDDVHKEFVQAVGWLEGKGVSGITGAFTQADKIILSYTSKRDALHDMNDTVNDMDYGSC